MGQNDTDTVLKEKRDGFWEIEKRETDLLNQRTNIFLLYNSILLMSLSLIGVPNRVKGIIAISGFVSTLIWLYMGWRAKVVIDYANKRVLESELNMSNDGSRIHTDFSNERNRTRPKYIGFSISVYIGRILPVIWAITWVALSVALFYF